MRAEIMTISPGLAREFLNQNSNNRPLSSKRVDAFASDMKSGNWQLNGEPIVFNSTGKLINGQHRLAAVIKSGVSVQSLVVFGVDNSVSLFDRGRLRRTTDTLRMAGYSQDVSNGVVVSAVKKIYCFCFVNWNVSDSQVEAFINRHKETLLAIYGLTTKKHNKNDINLRRAPLVAALLFAVENGVELSIIAKFTEILSTGFYESPFDTAAIVLRNDIIQKRWTDTGAIETEQFCMAVQAAIYDFANRIPRKRSYRSSSKHIYFDASKYKPDFETMGEK